MLLLRAEVGSASASSSSAAAAAAGAGGGVGVGVGGNERGHEQRESVVSHLVHLLVQVLHDCRPDGSVYSLLRIAKLSRSLLSLRSSSSSAAAEELSSLANEARRLSVAVSDCEFRVRRAAVDRQVGAEARSRALERLREAQALQVQEQQRGEDRIAMESVVDYNTRKKVQMNSTEALDVHEFTGGRPQAPCQGSLED